MRLDGSRRLLIDRITSLEEEEEGVMIEEVVGEIGEMTDEMIEMTEIGELEEMRIRRMVSRIVEMEEMIEIEEIDAIRHERLKRMIMVFLLSRQILIQRLMLRLKLRQRTRQTRNKMIARRGKEMMMYLKLRLQRRLM